MGDMSSMSRESRKQKLRSQMITPDREYPPSKNRVEEEELFTARQKKRRRHMVCLL